MENNIIGIFKSDASIGRSILTVETEDDIKENYPVSILSIARKHNIKTTVIVDDSFSNFPKIYKNWKKHNLNFIYGINFTVCNDSKDQSETSQASECKVSVLMKNSAGYSSILRLYNAINTDKNSFYYRPRASWSTISTHFDENLQLLIPPYNNFIHKNLLENGKCVPDFAKIRPIFTWAECDLPFDKLLENKIKDYAKNNNYEVIQAHPICYYKKDHSKQYQVFRAINKRSSYSSPELEHFSSNNMCFESYLEKIGRNINE